MRMLPLYLLFLFADVSRQPERLPLPAPSDFEDIEGIYWADGAQNGKPYRATVAVTRLGEAYLFQWQLIAGPSYDGVGVRRGDVVSVGWQAGDSRGVTQYRIVGAGSLIGSWVCFRGGKTDGGSHTETLVRIKKFPRES